PPLPEEDGAAWPGDWALGAAEPVLAAGRGGAPEGAGRDAGPRQRGVWRAGGAGAPKGAGRDAVPGERGLPGSVPPRAQPEGGGDPDSPSRGGSFSGGGVRPAPLLPVSAPRTRPAPLAREPEPACCVSSGSAPSLRWPAP